MTAAKKGDTVRVHYTGKLADGTVFDSSAGRAPLVFKLGSGKVIKGFDEAISGMVPGAAKTVEIPAAKAYGPRHEEMVVQLDRRQFPADVEPEIGQRFEMQQPGGQQIVVMVTAVSESEVTLDANPPLAGKDLIFDLELVGIG
ncbi:MAG: peptidylprolyl isomerase [Deltaproteobacteria bacterium RIFOXYD12_FULL_57_12]|nr:MAG: peptidylprolyl isomerase [Deltaproteobacteria bacterium RIFOXYD12_FULL_57_12]